MNFVEIVCFNLVILRMEISVTFQEDNKCAQLMQVVYLSIASTCTVRGNLGDILGL